MSPVSYYKEIISSPSNFLQAGGKAFYLFSTLSQIEAALFGIIFTITLIMVQIINDKYGINATKIVVDHKIVKRFISLFLVSILSSLCALASTTLPVFATVWPVGIITGIIFIARIPKFVLDISNLVNIYSIVDEIIKRIPHQMTNEELKLEQANDSGWFRTLLDLLAFTIEKKPVSIFHNILHQKIKPLLPTIVNNFPLAYFLEIFYLPLLRRSIEIFNRGAFVSILFHLNDIVEAIGPETGNIGSKSMLKNGKGNSKRTKEMEFTFFLTNLKETLISSRPADHFLKAFINDFLSTLILSTYAKKHNEQIAQKGLDILISIVKDEDISIAARCEALRALKQIYNIYDGQRSESSISLRKTSEDVQNILEMSHISSLECKQFLDSTLD